MLLDVKHLMVFYENALALNDFSLEVNAGEIVAVIGSNSAGKTTLMNAISGLILDIQVKEKRKGGERITILGEVWFNREDLSRVSPDHRVKKGSSSAGNGTPSFPKAMCWKTSTSPAICGVGKKSRRRWTWFSPFFPIWPAIKTRRPAS